MKQTDDDFEEFLARQPLRPIPPEWRAEILRTANSSRADTQENLVPWWRALLWPSPLAWAGVACTWLIIAGMDIAARPSPQENVTAVPIPSNPEIIALLIQQPDSPEAITDFQPQPSLPTPKPLPPGACNRPRQPEDTEFA